MIARPDPMTEATTQGTQQMTDKHTPGPWAFSIRGACVDGTNHTCADIFPVNGAYRGGVSWLQSAEHIGGIGGDEVTANARLIAAAPDLLAALEAMCRVAPEHVTQAAIDAIAKARGQV